MSGESLRLEVIPLQTRRAESDDDEEGDPDDSETPRNSQIVSFSAFKLPDDWIVEQRPRQTVTSGGRRFDKYYYEPGTGRMFRSLVSVKRYLMEGKRDVSRTKKAKSKDENTLQAEIQTAGSTSSYKLPNGWIVEEKPRKFVGVKDRTYIEPGTGQRFRTLRAIERYLSGDNASPATPMPLLTCGPEEQRASGENCCTKAVGKRSKVVDEDEIAPKSLKLTDESKNPKKSGSPKKINSEKDSKGSMVNLSSPPAKVKWVLPGTGGIWTPFLDSSKVPESIKLKWSEAFVLYIQDGDSNDAGS